MSTFISYSYIPKIKSPGKTAHMYIVNLFSSTTVELPSVTKLFADKFWKLMVKIFTTIIFELSSLKKNEVNFVFLSLASAYVFLPCLSTSWNNKQVK